MRYIIEDMKSPKEDYEICKKLYPGTRVDRRNFLSFYTLVIYHVFTTRSNKCTSKVVTPGNKRTTTTIFNLLVDILDASSIQVESMPPNLHYN